MTPTAKGVLYRTGVPLVTDADGAPRAYGLPGKRGLDLIGNATKDPRDYYDDDGNGQWTREIATIASDGTRSRSGQKAPIRWVGVVTGTGGVPIVQGDGDPAPGYLVSPTAGVWDPSLPSSDPRRYLDATVIRYFSPGTRALATLGGAGMGDLAWFVDLSDGTQTGAIIGDSAGNTSKAHEGSIALMQALGYDGDPRGGGSQPAGGDIAIVVFPGTAQPGPRPTYLDEAEHLFDQWGGIAEINRQIGTDVPAGSVDRGGGSHAWLFGLAALALVATVVFFVARR